jgi:hypothetical protein
MWCGFNLKAPDGSDDRNDTILSNTFFVFLYPVYHCWFFIEPLGREVAAFFCFLISEASTIAILQRGIYLCQHRHTSEQVILVQGALGMGIRYDDEAE